MADYIATTPQEQRQMLEAVGRETLSDLFVEIPQAARAGALDIPEGRSESEVWREMTRAAGRNQVFATVYRGAGAYRHYIPAIVDQVASKEAFVTAYTPYQAEISQGILQAIFEYQTMITELTGLAAANASVYDGAWAAAEALGMCREKKRSAVLISESTDPRHLRVMETYCGAVGMRVIPVPLRDGVTDPEALAELLGEEVCALYVQQVNFFGQIEDAAALFALAHEKGVRCVLGVHPLAAALLKSAGECGADIAVGSGQPLGLPMAFGGPALGFMASTKALMRKLPGRIVGQTRDAQGRRAFVLTLQAREQHIRREKAGSNICSNQALCALRVGAYLTAMGPEGLSRAARTCMANAAYLRTGLARIPGFEVLFDGPMFHEFVTTCPVPPQRLLARLEEQGILGGWPLSGDHAGRLLWCATEMNTQAEMDHLFATIRQEVGA